MSSAKLFCHTRLLVSGQPHEHDLLHRSIRYLYELKMKAIFINFHHFLAHRDCCDYWQYEIHSCQKWDRKIISDKTEFFENGKRVSISEEQIEMEVHVKEHTINRYNQSRDNIDLLTFFCGVLQITNSY